MIRTKRKKVSTRVAVEGWDGFNLDSVKMLQKR